MVYSSLIRKYLLGDKMEMTGRNSRSYKFGLDANRMKRSEVN